VKRNPDVVFGLKKSEENLSEYNKVDDKGRYRLLGLRQRGGAWRRSQRPMLFYPIYVNPEDNSVSLTKDLYHTEEVIPCRPSGEEGRWTWSKEKFEKEKHLLQGVKVNEGSEREKWDICRKDYLANDNGEEKASKVKSIWDEKDINYQNGGTEVKEIIGDGLFSYPKPLFLLKKIISSTSSFANTYLDFFAGSGTTLHAVMQMNDEDNGSRKCILVTNNENGICENVTYERNKRVINGYTKPNGDEVEGLTDNNLRYYRTSFVGRSRATKKMRQLMSLATDMLCIKEDLYTEQEQFGELSTHPKVMRYFTKGDKSMLIIYYEQAIAEIVEQIEKLSLAKPIKVYVFSPSEDPWEEDFEFVNDKVELCALPAAIYNTYKRILPKKKDERIDIDINAKESEQPKGESTLFDLFEEGGEQ
jgi:adenine-specific DNA-methyltransferase